MTAEVVVMNRLGVALASDSAASVIVGGRTKLYHADKLFMLSSTEPVGVMIHNNASLLDVPWEAVIKLFRSHLGRQAFDHLEDYADALIGWLNARDDLFPLKAQTSYYLAALRSYFETIEKEISGRLLRAALDDGDDGTQALAAIAGEMISKHLDEWLAADDLHERSLPAGTAADITGRLSGEINRLIGDVFPYLHEPNVRKLTELARLSIRKCRMLPESMSGLVVAGFGVREHFPAVKAYEIGGVFGGRLKYHCKETHRVDGDEPAVVRAYAQADMVETFLFGVSPALYSTITEQVLEVLLRLPDIIIDGLPRVSKARKTLYKAEVKEATRDAAVNMFEELRELRERLHYEPVLGSIAHLPKGELAQVAATLVSLSSFQKRVSISEDETVGGPIDVAVITKGDGFVWVDRKHYFKPELNDHFFRNRQLARLTHQENSHEPVREALAQGPSNSDASAAVGRDPPAAGHDRRT